MKLLPLELSLQNICHIKIVISLLNKKTDIIRMHCDNYFIKLLPVKRRQRNNQAMDSFSTTFYESQKDFLTNLLTNVETLPLPSEIKITIKGVAVVMGMKLLNWCYRIKRTFNIFPPTLWKCNGTIDEEENLELMFKNEELSFLTRFQIACYTCNEDRIREMWPDVPNSYKLQCEQVENNFTWEPLSCPDELKLKIDFIDLLLPKSAWYNALEEDQKVVQEMLVASLSTSNWMGVKHFWANLNQQKRQEFLTVREMFIRIRMMLLPRTHENCDTICRFYWQILNESDRRQADKALLPYACYNMLLMWPWNKHLQEFVEDHKSKFGMELIGENQGKVLNCLKTNPVRTIEVYHRACNDLYELFTYRLKDL